MQALTAILKAINIYPFTYLSAPASALQIPFIQNNASILWNLIYVYMNDFLIVLILALWIGTISYLSKKKSFVSGVLIILFLCPIMLDMIGFPQILLFVYTIGIKNDVLYQNTYIWFVYIIYIMIPTILLIRKKYRKLNKCKHLHYFVRK